MCVLRMQMKVKLFVFSNNSYTMLNFVICCKTVEWNNCNSFNVMKYLYKRKVEISLVKTYFVNLN